MSEIDTSSFARRVREKRGRTSLREAAAEIGDISIATLSRIEQGRDTNANTYLKICTWLGVSPQTFYTTEDEHPNRIEDHQDKILYHLRADRKLEPEVSEALQKMIELAYSRKDV